MSDNDDLIEGLVSVGALLVIGYGVYRVTRAVLGLQRGEEVTSTDLREAYASSNEADTSVQKQEAPAVHRVANVDRCDECGAEDPARCRWCRTCLSCDGYGFGSSYGECRSCDYD